MPDCKALSSYNIQLSISHAPICRSAQRTSTPRTVSIFPTSRSTGPVLRTQEKPLRATKPRLGLGNGRGAPPAGPSESTHGTLGWQREPSKDASQRNETAAAMLEPAWSLSFWSPGREGGEQCTTAVSQRSKERVVPKMQMIFQLEKSRRRVACSHMA